MRFIYIMDPLCSWSYANSRAALDLYIRYKWKFEFDLLTAGMWAGEKKRTQDSHVINYIRLQDHQIQTHTGAVFGLPYSRSLVNPDVILDSEPPSRAILTVKSLWQDSVFQFTSKVQSARFQDGKDLNDEQVYVDICDEKGWNRDTFLEDFRSDAMKKLTHDTFSLAARYTNAYPSLFLESEGRLLTLHKGYMPPADVETKIKEALASRAAKP